MIRHLAVLSRALRFSYLGVKLNSVVGLLRVRNASEWSVRRGCDNHEVLGQLGQLVSVGHPHLKLVLQALEQAVDVLPLLRMSVDVQIGVPVLLLVAGQHVLAVVPGELLETVADAQDGDPELEDARVDMRGALLVNGERTSREDHTLGLPGQLGDLLGAREHLGVDIELAEASRDEMGVLRSEITPVQYPAVKCDSALTHPKSRTRIVSKVLWGSLTVSPLAAMVACFSG